MRGYLISQRGNAPVSLQRSVGNIKLLTGPRNDSKRRVLFNEHHGPLFLIFPTADMVARGSRGGPLFFTLSCSRFVDTASWVINRAPRHEPRHACLNQVLV